PLPRWVCGTKILKIIRGNLLFEKLFTIECSPSLFSASAKANAASAMDENDPIVVELESVGGCPPRQIFDFNVGDTVEVFGTGIGLRGRSPDPCSTTYKTFRDGSRGIIK